MGYLEDLKRKRSNAPTAEELRERENHLWRIKHRGMNLAVSVGLLEAFQLTADGFLRYSHGVTEDEKYFMALTNYFDSPNPPIGIESASVFAIVDADQSTFTIVGAETKIITPIDIIQDPAIVTNTFGEAVRNPRKVIGRGPANPQPSRKEDIGGYGGSY